MSETPVIVACALSGVAANRQQCPYIPYTPDEIAEEARRAADAGAAVVHVRARHPDTGAPVHDVPTYRKILDAIAEKAPGVLVALSTRAAGASRQESVAPIKELHPDLGTVGVGSVTYAIYSPEQKRFQLDAVQGSTFGEVTFFAEAVRSAGAKPDLQCMDAGHVSSLKLLAGPGIVESAPFVSLVLGVHGGAEGTVSSLVHLRSLLPDGATWQAIGVRSPEQWRITSAALAMGGHVRVGFEDNYYVEPGVMATSNAELVEKAVRMAHDVGREPAGPEEVRKILGLRKQAKAKA